MKYWLSLQFLFFFGYFPLSHSHSFTPAVSPFLSVSFTHFLSLSISRYLSFAFSIWFVLFVCCLDTIFTSLDVFVLCFVCFCFTTPIKNVLSFLFCFVLRFCQLTHCCRSFIVRLCGFGVLVSLLFNLWFFVCFLCSFTVSFFSFLFHSALCYCYLFLVVCLFAVVIVCLVEFRSFDVFFPIGFALY